ncbi:MAG: DUF2807 domain-containing protein [Bacteroidales bacterium]|nr:DUF2807 domain-containing protein [Bacteroidales bacterium]
MKLQLFVFFISLFFATSCLIDVTGVDGNGNIIEKSVPIGGFNSIDISGNFDIILKQGGTEAVSIRGDENLMEYIITDVKSGRLEIGSERNLDPTGDIEITITFTELNQIDISGACDLISGQELNLDDLKINCSGAVEADLVLNVDQFIFEGSGASEIDLTGTARKAHFEISGAGDIDAFDFVIEDCITEVSGAATANLNVASTLDLQASGAASIRYKGGAAIVNQNLSGAASVKAVK